MSTWTETYSLEHSVPDLFIELLKVGIDKGWSIINIQVTPGDGFNTYKASLERVNMG